MATIGEIRQRVNRIKPNSYDIARWIGELDARIALDVMLMDISECEQFAYHRKPEEEQEGIVPLLKFPYDELYDLWLFAKIDAADGETELYQNDMAMFNAFFSEFAQWFVSTYDPAQNGVASITYYITAYALAVQQGFSGDMDSWLASLRGQTGKSAYEYAVEGGYTGTEADYRQYMKSNVETDTSFTKGGVPADARAVGVWKGKLEEAISDLVQNLSTLNGNITSVGKTAGSAKTTAEAALPKAGGSMTGNLVMNGHTVTGLRDPNMDKDAATKQYVDNRHKFFSSTILASGWSQSAPYTQTVAVPGILKEDYPHVTPVYSADLEEKKEQIEAYNRVSEGDTENDCITFTCLYEKPDADILIHIEVNR